MKQSDVYKAKTIIDDLFKIKDAMSRIRDYKGSYWLITTKGINDRDISISVPVVLYIDMLDKTIFEYERELKEMGVDISSKG